MFVKYIHLLLSDDFFLNVDITVKLKNKIVYVKLVFRKMFQIVWHVI